MNQQQINLLRALEARFFAKYPEGFDAPELQQISKKHRVVALGEQAQMMFAKDCFDKPAQITEDMVKNNFSFISGLVI